MTGSRGSLFNTFFILAIFPFINTLKPIKKTFFSIVLIFSIFFLGIIFYFDQISLFISREQGFDLNSLLSGRIILWQKVIFYLERREFFFDLFGNGAYVGDTYLKQELLGFSAHSMFLRTFTDLGLFGLIISVGILIKVIFLSIKYLFNSDNIPVVQSLSLF